ncbi:MAG: DUF6259 domain-containing protein [Chloroflexota bacterium]
MVYTLGNECLELCFDDQNQYIVSLRNKVTGDDYIKRQMRTPLCVLTCIRKGGDTREEFVPHGLKAVTESVADGRRELRIEFACATNGCVTLAIDLTITIELTQGEGESTWHLGLQNKALDYDVVEVLFPYLTGIYLGEDWQDNVLIYPHHAGEKTVSPIREYVSERFLNFWRAQTRQQGDLWWREINYCGLASMMWMYYYDSNNGLYIGSHDDDFLLTGLRVETGGPNDPWMGFGIRKYKRISCGGTWHSKPYVVAVNNQDWHWGARRYRMWIKTHIGLPGNLDYLGEEFSLNQCYDFKREGTVRNTFADIPGLYERGQQEFRARHVFIASWNRGGFDRDYPEYHPDMELGTPMDLAASCRSVNVQRGFVTFYINSRLFDTGSDYFGTLGKGWAIKDEQGDLRYEQYGPRRFAVLCPAHGEWQKHLMDIACWMVQCYGATGIYLDQLGSAEPFPCYDPAHSHEDIGEFNRGYVALLRTLTSRLRDLNPQSFLMIENCGDIYGQYVWGNLTWNGNPYDEFFNLYKYTFPEYVQVHMVNPRSNLTGEERKQRFYRDMERAVLLGAVFWLGLDKFKGGDEELRWYMKRAVNLRAKLAPLLQRATYVDTDGVTYLSDGIDISHWCLPENRHLYILSNSERKKDCFFDIDAPGTEEFCVLSSNIDEVEEEVRCTRLGDQIRISVPVHSLSYVLVDPGETSS